MTIAGVGTRVLLEDTYFLHTRTSTIFRTGALAMSRGAEVKIIRGWFDDNDFAGIFIEQDKNFVNKLSIEDSILERTSNDGEGLTVSGPAKVTLHRVFFGDNTTRGISGEGSQGLAEIEGSDVFIRGPMLKATFPGLDRSGVFLEKGVSFTMTRC